MKIKLQYLLFLTCLAMGIATSDVFSQDSAGLPDVEVTDPERDKIDKDKILYSPGEGETRYFTKHPPAALPNNTKDSVLIFAPAPAQKFKSEKPAPATKSTVDKQSKEEDSILSFNFLYYIIEKYKLQDIVD